MNISAHNRTNQRGYTIYIYKQMCKEISFRKKYSIKWLADKRLALLTCIVWMMLSTPAFSQFATIGGGALLSDRPAVAVAELHGQTPPFAGNRAYLTLSWTKQSFKPTIISAVERPVIHYGQSFTGLGAGLLWLEGNDYRPYPMLVSSTVVPLPVPKTSFIIIGSTLPFQSFEWSIVIKIGITLFFIS